MGSNEHEARELGQMLLSLTGRFSKESPEAIKLTALCRAVGAFAPEYADPVAEYGSAYASFWALREAGGVMRLPDAAVSNIENRVRDGRKKAKEAADAE